ncbi:swi5-dependent recombination DNA repair protein 1 homolog [Notechis scutatus]|uniref:Swi5-dependent recombination DNA repair protein 1 homolog n=1 Tax=Notechis scutatus TaxID=8663 RepID=A0A6J1TYV4_9SAUR|nr:swi5-dependent recombination DNA repair protein 1 homolog [Notechis scutatus]XP_026523232.1 swi5-dependent recombination DNA repair protein 1 homolog [Notechis scutatus]XP_026523240.1 swi5-dependent recombination DNA repair protein 1 homolog [Notechis scutatus]XP_026523249.1 swi5-dependent recombination DNA repair protein 1 homolog [Notechis scutatus]XP_026523257.1 swi5-dependent recombination DNA repair protein 1 homolog [Notechis scutatus]XP_026523267.1 swi5-dependent recombination DNA re
MGTPILNKPRSLSCTPENCENSVQSSSLGKQLMSTTLRERLKKTRRSFHSNFIVAKQLKIDDENNSNPKEKTLSKEEPCSVSHAEDKCLEKVPDETICSKSSAEDRSLSEYNGYNNSTHNSSEINLLGRDCKQWELLEEKMTLMKQLQEKEDILRRLKLVKLYRTKNNPEELQFLISKWRKGSQAILYELQSALSTDNKKLSLTQLIDNFGLDDKLLHYIRTDEDFTDP